MNENYWQTRWSDDQIRTLLLEQSRVFWESDTGIRRDKLADLQRAAHLPHAVVISGLRRVGKSTLLAQAAHQLGKESYYYLNFEDERFIGFQPEDANHLYQLLVELLGDRRVFLIDEIQNVPGWEHFVRRFMDMGFKFYITGSNASLLSSELGSLLTGRHIPIELYPFSFKEYLRFSGRTPANPEQLSTAEKGVLNSDLAAYLKAGGIPLAHRYPEIPLLRNLYDDILYRDIVSRYRIESPGALRELAFFLMSNPACPVSFNKLKAQLHLGSVNTIKSYFEYLGNSWLIFTTYQYDFSVKRQQIAPKKIYAIDSGLCSAVGFGFSANSGKLLENLAFLTLRQQFKEIYYYTTSAGHEIDFYIPQNRQLIQVCQDLKHPSTRERELRAISEAAQTIKVNDALILSSSNENDIVIQDIPVQIRSIAEWLINF